MTTYDQLIVKSKEVHEYTKDLIELSDVNYIPHYWFENLEWQIYDEVKDWMSKHPIEDLTKDHCELMAKRICEYVFSQIEREKTDFFMYHLPEFISDLYIKTNKICTQ